MCRYSLRSTADSEFFHNHILMYASKRSSFSPPVYEARTPLAGLDCNHHLNRPAKRKEMWWEAEVSRHKRFVSPVGCGKQISHPSYQYWSHVCFAFPDHTLMSRSLLLLWTSPLHRPPLTCRSLLLPPPSSRGHPQCQQHPHCCRSPHSHRPPRSCVLGHPAARPSCLLLFKDCLFVFSSLVLLQKIMPQCVHI